MVNKVIDIINEIREEKGENTMVDITVDSSLRRDIGFDPFDLALLTAKIEDQYDVDVFSKGIIDTVGELLSIMENK